MLRVIKNKIKLWSKSKCKWSLIAIFIIREDKKKKKENYKKCIIHDRYKFPIIKHKDIKKKKGEVMTQRRFPPPLDI